jgi:hypothetical protein
MRMVFLGSMLIFGLSCSSGDSGGSGVVAVAPPAVVFTGDGNASDRNYSPTTTTGEVKSSGLVGDQLAWTLSIKSNLSGQGGSRSLNVGATPVGDFKPGVEWPCFASYSENVGGEVRSWIGGTGRVLWESSVGKKNVFVLKELKLRPNGKSASTGSLVANGTLSFTDP